MSEALYERNGKSIKDITTDSIQEFDSINKAKAASVNLQKSLDGGKTGLGSVRVVK